MTDDRSLWHRIIDAPQNCTSPLFKEAFYDTTIEKLEWKHVYELVQVFHRFHKRPGNTKREKFRARSIATPKEDEEGSVYRSERFWKAIKLINKREEGTVISFGDTSLYTALSLLNEYHRKTVIKEIVRVVSSWGDLKTKKRKNSNSKAVNEEASITITQITGKHHG
eukprot:TRINITY_DN10764_c0_g1_i1.p1 TRINITY_DN10764_c0_g1~~TRINITY_DN10764_c0_g1_i1.p1  ORF type:complete len:167 (+),score=22.22 TRINITY_DN10764_c0_g1_i1:3-503(+)